MKNNIQDASMLFPETWLAQQRQLVSVAIKRGWIRFAAPPLPDVETIRPRAKKPAKAKRRG